MIYIASNEPPPQELIYGDLDKPLFFNTSSDLYQKLKNWKTVRFYYEEKSRKFIPLNPSDSHLKITDFNFILKSDLAGLNQKN